MKKYLPLVLSLAVLVATTGASFASAAAYDYHFSAQDSMDSLTTVDAAPSAYVTSFLAHDHTHNAPAFYYTDGVQFSFDDVNHNVSIGLIQPSQVDGLPTVLSDYGTRIGTAEGALSTLTSLPSTVSSHTTSINTMNALSALINANLYGTSTVMTAQAASTTNGLMTQVQSDKLDALQGGQAWSWSQPSRSLTASTGAAGFQPSATRISTGNYNITVTTTATIGGNSSGYVALEIAPTNSATAGDWIEMGRCGNSQAITLAVILQSVQTVSCQVSADIPAGYYAKLRQVTVAGTPSFSVNSINEVLK